MACECTASKDWSPNICGLAAIVSLLGDHLPMFKISHILYKAHMYNPWPALGRLRHEDHVFQASLGYVLTSAQHRLHNKTLSLNKAKQNITLSYSLTGVGTAYFLCLPSSVASRALLFCSIMRIATPCSQLCLCMQSDFSPVYPVLCFFNGIGCTHPIYLRVSSLTHPHQLSGMGIAIK